MKRLVQLKTTHIGQVDIRQHHIEPVAGQHGKRLLATLDTDRSIAIAHKELMHHFTAEEVITDDE